MSKKTVYITRKQLDEITGESGIYLDTVGGSANTKKSNEVAVDGTIDNKGDGNPITTDSLAEIVQFLLCALLLLGRTF